MKEPLLFTVDVEEWVIPGEEGLTFDVAESFRLGAEGLKRLGHLLEREGVRATLFVTLAFARRYTMLVRELVGAGHELALHAVEHTHDYRSLPAAETVRLLGDARSELEATFGVPILGYRANRFRAPAQDVLTEIGFSWTSNLHPTWVPGAYNNFRSPREIHAREGLLEVPISVSPRLRLPISWFWMRNCGSLYLKTVARGAARGSGYLQVYVHPWEYADLPAVQGLSLMGRLSIRRTGARFSELTSRFFRWARRRGHRSLTITQHLREQGWLEEDGGVSSRAPVKDDSSG